MAGSDEQLTRSAPFDLEAFRSHVTSQITRIGEESQRREEVLASVVEERALRFADQVQAVSDRLSSLRADLEERFNRSDPTALTTMAVKEATTRSRDEMLATRELLEAQIETVAQGLERAREDAEALLRRGMGEIGTFREEVKHRDEANRQLVEQRLTDLDRARELAADQLKELPEQNRRIAGRLAKDFARQMIAEREYILGQIEVNATRMGEKFAAIDGQFMASETSVDKAFAAAKEAVAEQNKANSAAIKVSEQNTKEQLLSLRTETATNFNALEDKITDARDRLTSIESLTRGISRQRSENRLDRGEGMSTIVAVIMAASLLISLASVIFVIVHH